MRLLSTGLLEHDQAKWNADCADKTQIVYQGGIAMADTEAP